MDAVMAFPFFGPKKVFANCFCFFDWDSLHLNLKTTLRHAVKRKRRSQETKAQMTAELKERINKRYL